MSDYESKYKHFSAAFGIIFLGFILLSLPFIFSDISLEWKGILKSLGISFIVIGSYTALNHYFLKKSFLNDLRQEVNDAFTTAFQEQANFEKKGITNVYDSFNDTKVLMEKIRSAENEVLILQTFLPEAMGIAKELPSLLKRNVKVQILLLNPEQGSGIDFGKLRSTEQGRDSDYISNGVKIHFQDLKNGFKNCIAAKNLTPFQLSKFEIKFYAERYPYAMYKVDDVLFIGFYWNHKTMTQGTVIEFNTTNNKFTADFIKQFSQMWDKYDSLQEIEDLKS